MRTAVVRVNVDPKSECTAAQLRDGMAALLGLARAAGADVVDNDLAAMPASRREGELLIAADDGDAAMGVAVTLCAKAFQSTPVPGVVTFISRGTDDDPHGGLAMQAGGWAAVPSLFGWQLAGPTAARMCEGLTNTLAGQP
ncbi:hypothetical protein [Mycobacterium avium]|uniref:hypothetical protein n=1 Tax=Mycobacterium avium TaxID=1764 RepID=UPI000B238A1F|nr:hypothetical protein [Mycobacterium avium]